MLDTCHGSISGLAFVKNGNVWRFLHSMLMLTGGGEDFGGIGMAD
jgi:hypothetical protein